MTMKEFFTSLKNKRLRLVPAMVLAVLVGSIAGVIAYYTSSESKSNTFEYGEIQITTNVSNGQVTISNAGNYDCYVRVFVSDENGNAPDNVGNGWTYVSSGDLQDYWYYGSVLSPNSSTTAIGFLDNRNVVAYGEAVQSTNAQGSVFSNAQAAFAFLIN